MIGEEEKVSISSIVDTIVDSGATVGVRDITEAETLEEDRFVIYKEERSVEASTKKQLLQQQAHQQQMQQQQHLQQQKQRH